MKRALVIGMMAALLASCGGTTGPQLPSRRMGQETPPDSAQLALLEFNQRLAMTADEQLVRLAQSLPEPYALYESSTWMYVQDRGMENEPLLQEGKEYTLHMHVYDLQQHSLVDTQGSYTIGKFQVVRAVDQNVVFLHPGAKARLLAPWYAAFGMQGTEDVPPYTNVLIDLEILR